MSDNLSGLKDFYLSETNNEPNNEEDWIAYQNTSDPYLYTLKDSSEGDKALTLFVRDFADNIASLTDTIILSPTISLNLDAIAISENSGSASLTLN